MKFKMNKGNKTKKLIIKKAQKFLATAIKL